MKGGEPRSHVVKAAAWWVTRMPPFGNDEPSVSPTPTTKVKVGVDEAYGRKEQAKWRKQGAPTQVREKSELMRGLRLRNPDAQQKKLDMQQR